jgi:uncharacterized LabA/DUF88 family protein
MRVALFFDGNNFYRSMDAFDSTVELDYDQLAAWVVAAVGGPQGELAGAYYYTGFSEQSGLDRFLRGLEMRTGFFVRREPVVERAMSCPHCSGEVLYRVEKRVDTRLVAEMIQLAAVGAFDRAVIFSGDEDLVPAVDAVQALGRQVYVASWAGRALSHNLRVHSFGHVDLVEGVEGFTTGRRRPSATEAAPADAGDLMDQLRHAVDYFVERGGQISRWYFENRWKPDGPCPPAGEARHDLLTQLIEHGQVEEFETVVNGRLVSAIRPSEPPAEPDLEP